MNTNTSVKTITDIHSWTPEKGDTLGASTFKEFKKIWDLNSKDVYKNSGTASYFYFMGKSSQYDTLTGDIKTGVEMKQHHYLCHAPWTSGHSPEHTDGFMNIFPNNLRPKSNARFYNFIFDPIESPWRDALKTVTIIRDPKNSFPMGLLWTNVEGCDIRLFTSLLIATRLCSGWALDNVWGRLCDLGFTQREALVLTPLFSWAGQNLTIGTSPINKYKKDAFKTTVLTHTGPWASDQPFGLKYNEKNRWDKFSPKSVLNITPTLPGGFQTSRQTGPNPCNLLWSGDKVIFQGPLHVNSKLKKMLIDNKSNKTLIAEIRERLHTDTPINWSKEF